MHLTLPSLTALVTATLIATKQLKERTVLARPVTCRNTETEPRALGRGRMTDKTLERHKRISSPKNGFSLLSKSTPVCT